MLGNEQVSGQSLMRQDGNLHMSEGCYRRKQMLQQTVQANGRQGSVNSRWSDAAESKLHCNTQDWGRMFLVQLEGGILSRERRVSCSAIAGIGITRGRQGYTDCYLAIRIHSRHH